MGQIIRESFGLEEDRIHGIPGWAASKSFDIQAKVEPSDAPQLERMTIEQRRLMVISILAARFDLQFHRGKRNLPVYALQVAKGAPKLQSVRPESDTSPAGSLLITGAGRLESHGCQMKLFANWLSGQVGRTVIDKTGLTDTYYFTFEWTPDETPFPATAGQDTTSQNEDGGAVQYPSLFKALQEELGLKLDAQHGLTDVIVIDHIGEPSEN